METAVQTREEVPPVAEINPSASKGLDRRALGRAASNLGVAAIFFLSLASQAREYHGLTDLIWMLGAGLMGILSLVRVPPKSALITFSSVVATAFMMVTPLWMRPLPHMIAGPALLSCAIAVQFIGMILSLGARLYLGRRFGLLPANRGIVSTGPFRLVRHPIYLGWLVLSFGFVIEYPTLRNIGLLTSILPVMIWRIALEERLLGQDPAYRPYCQATRYRVLPFIY